MKRSIFWCLFLSVCFIFTFSCNNITNTEKQEFRIIAWKSLSDQAQETIIHPVYKATVNFDAIYRPVGKPGAEPIPAVSVTFNTVNDALLGPIVVYIDRETREVLGQALRF